MKNKKAIIIIAIIAVAALVWYFMFYKKATPGTSTTAVTPPTQTGTGAQTTTVMPDTQGLSNSQTTSGVNQSSADSVITAWANTLTNATWKQQTFAALQIMTASDKAALADIINTWNAGLTPSAAQVNTWNTLRTQYHFVVN